ncbi:MAG: chaperone modulator CbpM [Flavobacteriaceae bacterium]|nr:chaperone modulator CbpM [Flavobacteriaceae bacterium]
MQEEAISNLEKLIRLHADLGVNMEGLDVIHHLLHKVSNLQHEINQMRNKLRFYED